MSENPAHDETPVKEESSASSEAAVENEAAATSEASVAEDGVTTSENSESQDSASEAVAGEESPASSEAPAKVDKKKWYVVHTYSGYENKAKQSLEERIKNAKAEDAFGEILIPTEQVVDVVKGKKRTSKRKFFPGYLIVNMFLDDNTWHIVKNTPKITCFVGNATKPPSIPEREVVRLTTQISEGTLKPTPRVLFEDGDKVRVNEGPFANFNGTVEDVKMDKRKVRVLVSIFGRSTPVELDFEQVEKL